MAFWKDWLGVSVLCAAAVGCGRSAATENTDGPRVQQLSAAFSFPRLEKVDMLFVIDNSNSMAGEQAQLRAQFPRLMRALTTGTRGPDDTRTFTPVRDLHVGVVSTDMGIPGVELPPSCHADGGDDGRLSKRGHGGDQLSCNDSYPSFLSYEQGVTDPEQLAHDFSCVASLGTGGCGFEQQLEAGFKALWPETYRDAAGDIVSQNPFRFISIYEAGTWGRGDVDPAAGGNLGFLRDDPDDPSLLVIVLVTDEEDCSVKNTDHLKPNNQLLEGSPYRSEDINLRCFNHPEFLYSIKDRYLDGFRKLRPGREDLVVFSAIVGVPPDLVSSDVLARTNFDDDTQREAFYDAILKDDRMQEVLDPSTNPGSGMGNLKPSCVYPVPGETYPSTAFPPRRIVELARAFGPNGMVQSICQDDFGPAVDMLVNTMAKSLTEMCMPQNLLRHDDGLVSCKLYWELPDAQSAEAGTPTSCDQLGALLADGAQSTTTADGHARCEIQQVSVTDATPNAEQQGWYYDDFTSGLDTMCSAGLSKRVAFSAHAQPPRGVSVKLDCAAGAAIAPAGSGTN